MQNLSKRKLPHEDQYRRKKRPLNNDTMNIEETTQPIQQDKDVGPHDVT